MVNKNMLLVISSISGILAGGITGFFIGKKYGENKTWEYADMIIEENSKCYKELIDEYNKEESSLDNPELINPEMTVNDPDLMPEPFTSEKREDIKKKLKENYEKTTDYSKMYDNKNDEENEEYNYEDEEDDQLHDIQKNMKPKIISETSLGDLPPYYEHDILHYYTYDDVITTDDDELIMDPERILGDCLTKYGFIDNEEKIIFIQNFSLDTVYEVQKVFKSYNNID